MDTTLKDHGIYAVQGLCTSVVHLIATHLCICSPCQGSIWISAEYPKPRWYVVLSFDITFKLNKPLKPNILPVGVTYMAKGATLGIWVRVQTTGSPFVQTTTGFSAVLLHEDMAAV
jgi:hypothetical protein